MGVSFPRSVTYLGTLRCAGGVLSNAEKIAKKVPNVKPSKNWALKWALATVELFFDFSASCDGGDFDRFVLAVGSQLGELFRVRNHVARPPPFLFVHGCVRGRHQLSQRNWKIRIIFRYAHA